MNKLIILSLFILSACGAHLGMNPASASEDTHLAVDDKGKLKKNQKNSVTYEWGPKPINPAYPKYTPK